MSSKLTFVLAGILMSAMAAGQAAGQNAVPTSGRMNRHPQTSGAPAEAAPTAEYQKTEVRIGDDKVYVDNDFSISNGDGWSFIPVTFLFFEKDKPLRRTADQDFRVEWPMVIPPANSPASWRDTTVNFTKAELAGAVNLPKGQRTVLWVVPALYHIEAKSYLSFGWDAAAPLVVTTDADGKITALETFPTAPPRLEPNHPSQRLEGKECKIETKFVKLKDDAKLVKNAYGFQLVGPTAQAGLNTPGRGAFFGPIDTPEKARELFELGLGDSKIIKNKKQYEAIAEEGKHWSKMFYQTPDTVGLKVTEVPGLGYRVQALVLDYSPVSGAYTGVSQYDTYISPKGVMTEKGWTTGIVHDPMLSFYKTMQTTLKDDSVETVPVRVTVTDKDATAPTMLNVPPPAK